MPEPKKTPCALGLLAHVDAGRCAPRKTLPKNSKTAPDPFRCGHFLFDRLDQVFCSAMERTGQHHQIFCLRFVDAFLPLLVLLDRPHRDA